MSAAHDQVVEQALAWIDAGKRAALATVIETWGSAPRPVGSQLAISAAAELAGSVSGGCVEGAVVAEALEALEDGQPRVLEFGVSDDQAFAVGLACGGRIRVMVEPIGGESGAHPVHPDWNKTIRKLCDQYGSLLIFDEVVTGFRLDMGGAQKLYNIMPDITVLGKIITHGYPSSGAVAGRKDVMKVCSGSMGDKIFVGGTLAANPISMAACYYALKYMAENDAVAKATAYANRLTKALNDLYATRPDLGFFVYNFGAIMHYMTTAFFSIDLNAPNALTEIFSRNQVADDYQVVTMAHGLCTLAGTRMYTCMQHDDASLKKTL
ncbi:MAG: hypothetical protein CVT86_07255, partial [Alphaproteobacteria bacterium HGW-Alphaproteobacteria-8]